MGPGLTTIPQPSVFAPQDVVQNWNNDAGHRSGGWLVGARRPRIIGCAKVIKTHCGCRSPIEMSHSVTDRNAARPRTRCTTHAFSPTASHASSRAPNGRVVRRVRGPGSWSKASQACGRTRCRVSGRPSASAHRARTACGVAEQRCHTACIGDCGLRTQCVSTFVNRGLLPHCQRPARASRQSCARLSDSP